MRLTSLAIWLGLLGLLPGAMLAAGLADPTRPPYRQVARKAPVAVPDSSGWRLTMIRLSDRDRIAVVNGRLVAVGDRVGDARVVAIRPGAVELVQAGKRFTVKLSRARVKRVSGVRHEAR